MFLLFSLLHDSAMYFGHHQQAKSLCHVYSVCGTLLHVRSKLYMSASISN